MYMTYESASRYLAIFMAILLYIAVGVTAWFVHWVAAFAFVLIGVVGSTGAVAWLMKRTDGPHIELSWSDRREKTGVQRECN